MDTSSIIEERLRGRPRRRIERAYRAAVLVPILTEGGPDRLLLTRRSEDLPTHQGQVAFPGGSISPSDAGAVEAALREAREEIGLDPGAAEVLGLLDDFTTWDGRIAVTPVAARIAGTPAFEPHTGEVARIFEIPVDELARPGRWTWRPDPVRGEGRRLWYFEHDGETLWGLSARIVIQLLELAGLPSPRPGGR
ncbi:MAG TPA: CoA pyrophosphatase [Candidatus Saccharimonadales bacterium]|nr:CoA pyrophosphatase [Candidatus Saccharimonadales bacterium]